jgi:hypothetical protein
MIAHIDENVAAFILHGSTIIEIVNISQIFNFPERKMQTWL